MKKLLLPLILSFLATPLVSHSAPFKINFEGELESLTDFGVPGVNEIDSVFSIGDLVFGSIIVDTDNLATTTISSFDLTIGSYSASASSGSASVRNDNQAGSAAPVVDSILIAGSDFTSTAINGFSVDRLQFSVGTENLAILDASSVIGPNEILALWNDTPNYFSGNLNFMSFGDGTGEDETARFALTSVTTSAVPEPSVIALMGAGLFGIGLLRRKVRA